METADRFTRPPSHWLGNVTGEWSGKDFPLTLAFTIYKARLCDCGHDRMICRHPDNDGWFKAKTSTCHAKAEVERLTGAKGYKPEPGQMVYAEYTRPASKPLPPFPTP